MVQLQTLSGLVEIFIPLLYFFKGHLQFLLLHPFLLPPSPRAPFPSFSLREKLWLGRFIWSEDVQTELNDEGVAMALSNTDA